MSAPRLLAVSDLHVRHPENRAAVERLRPDDAGDWLIVAGDVGEQADDVVTAFIDVSVAPARSVGFDDVALRISRFPEVRSVYLVSGGHDLRCTVTGRSLRAVSDFVSQKLSTIDRVQSTATHFVLKAYKRAGVAFVDAEPDHRLPVTP